MAVEMGAKTAYMQPNQAVLDYVSKRAVRPFEVQYTDPDFKYEESYVFDVSELEPQLACPHSVDNVAPLSEVIKDRTITLNQGYIGSCTGGREEDRPGSKDSGRKAHSEVRETGCCSGISGSYAVLHGEGLYPEPDGSRRDHYHSRLRSMSGRS